MAAIFEWQKAGGRTRSRVTHIMPSQQNVSHSVAVLFLIRCS